MLAREREQKRRAKWELFSSERLVETVHKARELGWADKKVQVRVSTVGLKSDGTERVVYSIEPFEHDCGCSNILKYDDYGRIEETLHSDVK